MEVYILKMFKLNHDNHQFCSFLIEGTILRYLRALPYPLHFTCYLYHCFLLCLHQIWTLLQFIFSSALVVKYLTENIYCLFLSCYRKHECLLCFLCNLSREPYNSLCQFLLNYKTRLLTH